MDQAPWTDTLLNLLQLTQKRSSKRELMKERFAKLLAHETHILDSLKIIKIAGTNGKGSVAALLEASLAQTNQKVGLFTSPHLYSITERIRINRREVSLHRLDHHARNLKQHIDKFIQTNGPQYTPSFFEILILLALRLFHEQQVEIAIIEAGVGGTNDSTSLLPAVVSAITSIGDDHHRQLGPTLAAIANDKAGIAPSHTPLILGPAIDDALLSIIQANCSPRNVSVKRMSIDIATILSTSLEGTRIRVQTEGLETIIHLKLLGHHQADNFITAFGILQYLKEKGTIHSMSILEACETVSWPGRMEVIPQQPSWLLDVAHNVHALNAISRSLEAYIPYRDRVIVYGSSEEKDYLSALGIIHSLAPERYLVSGFYKSLPLDTLQTASPGEAEGFVTPEACVDQMIRRYKGTGKTIIVVGSVFLVGNVRHYLMNRAQEGSNNNQNKKV